MRNRIGLLALLIGVTSCSGGGAPSSATAPGQTQSASSNSISGVMVPFALNTTYTYQTVNAASPFTVTLHANNNNASGGDVLSAFVTPGIEPSAITSSPSTTLSQSLYIKPTTGSFAALSVVRTRIGAFPIPGAPELVPSVLTVGQTFSPYVGVSATVLSVGAVKGSSVCSSSTGAMVAYHFQGDVYTASYVPGCGITDFVTNTGVELRLVSISQNTDSSVASAERAIAGTTLLDTIRNVTNALFRH